MNRTAIVLAVLGALCAFAGCGTSQPVRIRTETEQTERVIQSSIMESPSPAPSGQRQEPPETITTRTTREEHVIQTGPVVQ